MTTYSDYFALAKDYYAAISRHNINLEGNRWHHTYPHETFIELLKKTQAMLGREQKRPLWIEGIYGTGKSRVAWTLRELLLCPDAELSAYFNSYEDLRRETDLRDKLLGHKQGRIIAPMRFSSSEISSLNDLIMSVYAGVIEELEKQRLNTLAEKTLTGGVIRWLEDEDNSNYMTSLLAREPYKSDGAYGGISGGEARQRLMSGGHHDLLLAIMKIARERNIQAITFGMDDLCAWIKEVIAINDLKAIVFIWDEFSNYFMQNPTTFGTFQELAQLADTAPFYLVLVTQAIATLFAEADQSAKILTKRFNIQHIALPDSTAFKLIGHGLKIKDVYKAEWNSHRDDLNNRLEDARRAIANVVPELDQEDFKRILPIHPYAAYVLKNVAAVFDSNQRSMFEFLENNEEGMQAFRWFIANHSPENADILSVDLLWDYFYKTGRSPSGALGRSNLDMQVRDIMDSYPTLERKYPLQGGQTDSPEHRVLKTVIILQALAKKNPKDNAFQATEENLRAAFNGIVGLESGIGVSIAKRLVNDKVLFEDRGVYQVPIGVGVDQAELYEHIERTRKQLKTKDLIRDFEPKNMLASDASFERRFGVIYRASIDDFKTQLNRLINEEDNGYRMKAMLCFARNELEAGEMASCLAEASRSDRIGEILLIDATATRLPEKKQEEWIEATARSAYFARKDSAQSKNAADAAASLLNEWESAIRDGRFRLWSKKYPDGLPCNTGENLKDQLKAAVTARFPYTFDYVQGRTEALFKQPNIKAISAALTEQAATPISRQQVENILTGVKGLAEYWKLSPDLPLSRLKRRLDGKIAHAFAPGGPGKISIRELGDDLLKNGFMPSLLYAWLTAFLLKEYADSSYRYSDGQTGDAMSSARLADIISGYFKMLNGADPRYRDMYLEKLTKEQRAFADLAAAVFNVDAAGSPEHIARAITARVKDFGYPLWCLESLQESVGLERFIEYFAILLNPAQHSAANCGAVATEIGRMALATPDAGQRLKPLFSRESLENGMRAWLETFEDGAFQKVVAEIQAVDPLADVRDAFGSDGAWLWDKATGVEQISKLFRDYSLVAASMAQGFITSANSLTSCYAAWRDKIRQIRIPCDILMERDLGMKPFLRHLKEIAQEGRIRKRQDEFYEMIANDAESCRELFNNCRYQFQNIYADELTGFSDQNKQDLYNRLDLDSFLKDRAAYEGLLHEKAEEIRSGLKRSSLCNLWREKTGCSSPLAWSEAKCTPIAAALICLLPEEYAAAIKTCAVIDDANATESAVAQALAFWERNVGALESLSSATIADDAFRERVIGKRYRNMLTDLDAARSGLNRRLGTDVHSWLDNPEREAAIEAMAAERYQECGREMAERKIDAMTADEAKACLKRLAQTVEVGIKLLAAQEE